VPFELPAAAVPQLKRQLENVEAQTKEAIKQSQDDIRQELSQNQDAMKKAILSDLPKLPFKVAASKKGFTIESEDDAFRLDLHGYFQTDGRFYTTGNKPSSGSTFIMRRVRPIFEGHVYKYFKYRIMPDFGQGSAVIQDVFLDFEYFGKALKIRGGKYKQPVGLEELRSSSKLSLLERSLASRLVPARDIGFMAHGELLDGHLAYEAGVFNGVPDQSSANNIDTNSAKDFAARLFAHPFKSVALDPIKGLGVGFAGTYGDERTGLPTFATFGRNTWFRYRSSTVAAGERWRVTPQMYHYWGPFGLIAEFVYTSQAIKTGGTPGPAMRVGNWGWEVQGSFMLTGEENSYKGPKLADQVAFDPLNGRWGSFEVAARGSQLGIDDDVFRNGFADITTSARKATEWVIGINWYMNDNIKLMLDYARTSFDGGGPGGRDKQDESVIATRVQINF
jgi:phosphate-selective porin OprO/OprP